MKITFLDMEDSKSALNGKTIETSRQLLEIFAELRKREPFICKLTGDNGFYLDVGIGRYGFAQYSRADGTPPYLAAVAPHIERAHDYTEFLCAGTPTPVANRYCMPFEAICDIVRYFSETGHNDPAFAWESA